MSQTDDLHSESEKMRYFTPQLFLQLNSSDSNTVDLATEQWEKAVILYRKTLERISREMPSQSRLITNLSLHDWQVLQVAHRDSTLGGGSCPSVYFVLKQDRDLVILWYALAGRLRIISTPKEWSFSKQRLHWLYDELDFAQNKKSFVHRILLSDGTTMVIPFSNCQVVEASVGHPIAQSDLLQLA